MLYVIVCEAQGKLGLATPKYRIEEEATSLAGSKVKKNCLSEPLNLIKM